MGVHDWSMLELAARLARGECSSVEATRACLARVTALEPHLGAFLAVDDAGALAAAAASDARRRAGALASPLDGVPVALKDNLLTAGLPHHRGLQDARGLPAAL